MIRRLLALLGLFALVCLPSAALAQGALRAQDAQGRRLGTFPLAHTDVRIEVAGGITGVTVTQRFRNEFDHPIEAAYVFPLPDDAAIDAMSMRVGDRTIRATIARRREARETYDRARAQGHRAALLEQERPNIFTMTVANLEPGRDIEVSTHFFGRARYDHGAWELAFPMVVGPRYVPGDPLPRAPRGAGTRPDTDRVPDGSRISPAYVPPGTRSGHAITLTATLDPGGALREIASPSHEIEFAHPDTRRVSVSLRNKDEIPNRDFVLRWRTAASQLEARALMHRPEPGRDGYLALSLEPRRDVPATEVAPRELVFLLDTSGSMQGAPLDAVKRAIRRALTAMDPQDTFTLIDFADEASSLSPHPLRNTRANVGRALAWLEHLRASGGTNQLAGIHAALSLPGDPMRVRYVVFMTDGYIGNEREVADLTRREIGAARIFSFGVGAAVNRFLLDEVAAAGRGVAEYLRPDEDPDAVIERLYARIGQPWITDVSIAWGEGIRDALPSPMPDLSGLSPLTALARFSGVGPRTVTVRGRLAGRPFAQTVTLDLPAQEPSNPAVASVWARERIATLERAERSADEPARTREEVTALALAHHLVSTHTSFVAVDESASVGRGSPRRVDQPLDGPEGVDLDAAGGGILGQSIGDAFGAGGLGLSGQGWGGGGAGEGTLGLGTLGTVGHGQGYGTGLGSGLRGRAAAPTVRAAPPAVQGALSVEVIRRVVLRNLGQVRHCYERALATNPSLMGRIGARFTLGPDGRVIAVQLIGDTVGDPGLGACLQQAIARWVFPAPQGAVTITYPFNFSP